MLLGPGLVSVPLEGKLLVDRQKILEPRPIFDDISGDRQGGLRGRQRNCTATCGHLDLGYLFLSDSGTLKREVVNGDTCCVSLVSRYAIHIFLCLKLLSAAVPPGNVCRLQNCFSTSDNTNSTPRNRSRHGPSHPFLKSQGQINDKPR